MKKMSRFLAMALALLMLLTATAAAEESTLYRFSLYDPQLIIDGEVALDMTNLNPDLVFGVTDSGFFGLMLEIYADAGDYFDYVSSLNLQLDGTELVAWLDGMRYAYGIDLADVAGEAAALDLTGMRTALNTPVPTTDASLFGAEQRFAAVEMLVGSFVTGSDTRNGVATHTFEITKETGAELYAQLVSLVAMADMTSGTDYASEMSALDLSFSLNGTLTAMGNPVSGSASCSLESEGKLYMDGEFIPFTLTYRDDMADVQLDLTFVNPADSTDTMGLVVSSDSEPVGNRSRVTTTVRMDVEGDWFALEYTSVPDAASERVDSSLSLTTSEDDTEIALEWSTGCHDADNSFYGALTVTEDGYPVGFYLDYQTSAYTREDGESQYGTMTIGLTDGGSTMELSSDVEWIVRDIDTSEWMFNGEGATMDLMTMSDSELEAALGQAGEALMAAIDELEERVPQLAFLLNTFM